MNLPPDVQTRALALQAAVTALGKGSYIEDLHEIYPSGKLEQLTVRFSRFIRTGQWNTGLETE